MGEKYLVTCVNWGENNTVPSEMYNGCPKHYELKAKKLEEKFSRIVIKPSDHPEVWCDDCHPQTSKAHGLD